MKQPFQPKLSDRLSEIATSLDVGNGDAQIVFDAAESLDDLSERLCCISQAALYMRSTLAQIEALLRGETLFGMAASDDHLCVAELKAKACLRVVGEMDFRTKGKT